jgi:hypothetical protein
MLFTIILVGCSLTAARMRLAEKQKHAIQEIDRHSGVADFMSCALYDYETDDLGEFASVKGTQGTPSPVWLGQLLGKDFRCDVSAVDLKAGNDDNDIKYLSAFPKLRGLWLDGPNFSDSGLRELARLRRSGLLTELRRIEIDNADVTDSGIEGLGGFENLRKLRIVGVRKVTSKAFRFLRRLNSLESLTIRNSAVTDNSLLDFNPLIKLRFLSLEGPGITNAGIAHIATLKNLETIYIRSPNVTGTGLLSLAPLGKLNDLETGDEIKITIAEANELKKKLPNCKVIPAWNCP